MIKKILILIITALSYEAMSQGVPVWDLQNAKSKNYMIRSGSGGEFRADSVITYLRDSLGFAIGSGGGGGVTQINTSSPLTGGPITTTGTIGIQEAATNQSGYLSFANFTAFNNKLGYNGVSNRVAVWNASGLTYNNFSSVANNLGLGTISPATWITNGRGLAIMDSTATTQTANLNFINRTSNNYHWWQMYTQRTGNAAGRFALWSDAGGGSDKFTIDYNTFQPGFRYLQGTGSRMVVADGNGLLSSMAIPATGPTYTEGDGIDITSNVIKVQHFGDGLSVNSSGISLNTYMQNIASNAGTGIMIRTSGGATGGSAYRTLTQGTGISITNGNGVSGNPTITNSLPFSPASAGTTNQILTKTSGGYDWTTISGGTGTVTAITAGSGISTSSGGLNAQITTSGTLYNVAARVAELSRNASYNIAASAATDNTIDFITPQLDYANSMTADVTSDYISVPSGGSQSSTFFYTVTIKPSVTTDISIWVKGTTNLIRTTTKQTCPTNQTCTISFSSRGIFNTPALQQYKLILQSSASANIEVMQGYFTMSGNY